jgi:NAD(P)-dependent dehydrogenase (short-subunit alcohol dehydrogenase family)
VIVTGAAGALGSAYVRALVANGYPVVAVDRMPGVLSAFRGAVDNPYDIPPAHARIEIPIRQIDLAYPDAAFVEVLRGAYGLIMTAANPLPFQSKASADRNHAIDVNSIDAALASHLSVVIYTSSLWRLHGLIEGDRTITPEMSAPGGDYGESKQRTRDVMQARAASHPGVHFVVNDHGWFPREATGAPPTNVPDRGLQSWTAEAETQQYVLRQLEMPDRADLPGNFHGFIVSSRNIPTIEAVRRGHRPFIYDLSAAERIGVRHRANVYDLLEQYRTWRDIPIYME